MHWGVTYSWNVELSQIFTSKQCDQELSLSQTCFQLPRMVSVAFESNEHKYLFHNFSHSGGPTQIDFSLSFFNRSVIVLAPKRAVVLKVLLKPGSFPSWWLKTNVAPIPKRISASFPSAEYHPTSITHVLFKIFEWILSKQLSLSIDGLFDLIRICILIGTKNVWCTAYSVSCL